MITSLGLKNRRTGTTAATALAATALVLLPTWSGQAADILKADNTDPLSLTSSWVPGVVPGVDDVAVWNNTVTGANATTLDLDLSWRGIRIANPGGAVSIANTEAILSLGADGIDLSAATQNLTIGTSLVATADQTWSLASGRTFNLWTVNTNRGLSGEGDVTLQGPATGSGTIVMLPGSTGSVGFDDGSSNSTFMGDWIIGPNVTVQVIRNGRSAWGNGVIRLNGGRIGQIQGQWTWTNEIALGTGTTSTIANFSTGANRFLKLQGTISGGGNLILDDTTGAMGNNALGFIVTGTNTMSGTVTIPASRLVRLGGVPGDSVSTAAGIGGTFGTAGVVNNGTLTLSHSDAWTFGNNVSGSGTLVIGNSAITGTGTQVATVSGANTYTGITTVNNGRLNLTGSLTSTVVLQQGGSISGAGTTTGSMNFFGGTQILLAGGETTTGLSSSGASFFAPTKASFLTAPAAATIYDILTYGPGNVTEPGNLSINAHGTLTNTGTKFTFLAAGSQSRTWKGVTDTWQEGINTP
ncbi:MAG: beta strand repeat-containing protein, partial [Chthoniobacteraceae bacterium]